MVGSSTLLRTAGVAIFALLAATPAFAGVVAVPAPLLGAGVPALAAFAAGYWVLRKRRQG